MAIMRQTEARLELKAAARPAPQQHAAARGATLRHTDDAALLYVVGGVKATLVCDSERISLDLAQLKQLQASLPEVIADLEPK
jgi:hypothetical protein